jgi:hypothetical protein
MAATEMAAGRPRSVYAPGVVSRATDAAGVEHSARLDLSGWGPGGRRFRSGLPDSNRVQDGRFPVRAELAAPFHWGPMWSQPRGN